MRKCRLKKDVLSIWKSNAAQKPSGSHKGSERHGEALEYIDRKNESIHVGSTQPFHVFGSGPTFFFILEDGSLYVSERKGKGRTWERLWGRERPPIRVVLTNTATGKTYAFAERGPANGNVMVGLYFELTREPKPAIYRRNTGIGGTYPDVDQAAGCAYVLGRDGKITLSGEK